MQEQIRPLGRGMRAVGTMGSILVFLAGIQLFVLSDHTDRAFAWTIRSPLTAAFMGAFYWSALVIILANAGMGSWASARQGLPPALAFTSLTLAGTLLGLGVFHLHSRHVETVAFTWSWIVVYAAVPVLLVLVWLMQTRVPGADPPRVAPLPRPLRILLAAQGLGFTGFGVALFFAPGATDGLWPWAMTALAGRVLGAWLVAIGLLLVGLAIENDWGLSLPAFAAYLALGALTAIDLLRYGGEVRWSSPSAWVFASAVGLALVVGGYGSVVSWSRRAATGISERRARAS